MQYVIFLLSTICESDHPLGPHEICMSLSDKVLRQIVVH